MSRAFQPLGDQARWRMLYDKLGHYGVGDIITYEVMGEILNLDPHAERAKIQHAMRRAAHELEEVDKQAIEPVPNVGYRIVTAPEHLRLARDQQRRSSRALVRGRSKVINVDWEALEPEIQQAFKAVAAAFAMQQQFIRRTDVRQRRLEVALATVKEESTRTSEEVAELRARLERLESERGSDD